jgi:tRNA 5-methylaminomethyl-2-thiouridine biosynthesis bifunctional protein
MVDVHQTLKPLEPAEIQWSEKNKPASSQFDDFYFSTLNGIDDSRYVFLKCNDLPERWSNLKNQPYIIAETGFGTGLNFLLTWQAWKNASDNCSRLHYISTEKHPLRLDDLRRAMQAWPELNEFSSELINNYPTLVPGQHRIVLENGNITLDLLLGDALEQLSYFWDEHWAYEQKITVDSWYLDGFSPSKNPNMWSDKLFNKISEMSGPSTQFATYSAARNIRDRLEKHGFKVEKIPGYGEKREMLKGHYFESKKIFNSTNWTVPWHLGINKQNAERHAIIIGAGLAGCTTAEALTRRGWNITLIEQHASIASEASGNNQGALYTRLSHKNSTLSQFTLHSYLHSLRYFKNKFKEGLLQSGRDGSLCGALHLAKTDTDSLHPQLDFFLQDLKDLAYFVPSGQTETLCGIKQLGAGTFFPGAGWISPGALCRQIVTHPSIELITNCGAVNFSKKNNEWKVFDARGQDISSTQTLIIAAGTGCENFDNLEWLPLQKIRGQVSYFAENAISQQLKTVLCHDGYITPACNSQHCIGATFDIGDNEKSIRELDHHKNIQQLTAACPALGESFQQSSPDPVLGRVAYRYASPDYLPLVGPVPNLAGFDLNYSPLRKDARKIIDQKGSYLPGLFLNTGHGSKGLTSTPWSAEFLASLICDEALPCSLNTARALFPARFIVRDLKRNKR